MQWIVDNWPEIAGGLLALYGMVQIIVKLTPTKRDDAILAKVNEALDGPVRAINTAVTNAHQAADKAEKAAKVNAKESK